MKVPRIQLCRRSLGEIIPMGYGLAWEEPWADRAVFFPFPLNIIARWGRDLYFGCVRYVAPSRYEAAINAAFEGGRDYAKANMMAEAKREAESSLFTERLLLNVVQERREREEGKCLRCRQELPK